MGDRAQPAPEARESGAGCGLLKNTSRYPTETVRALIAFAMETVWSEQLAVHVKNSRRAYAGRAYARVPQISSAAKHHVVERLVTIRLGAPAQFPVDNMCMTWKYHPWQDPAIAPPTGYVEGAWGRQLRRVRWGYEMRYLEPRRHPYGGQHSPLIVMGDWQEALVAVAAHEARHIWQFATGARRSEVDAERHAAARLVAFRLTLSGTDPGTGR